jgi:cytidylate kinase
MTGINQLDLCRAYLRSATGSDRTGNPIKKPVGPVVTISREAGARGNSIAEDLVARLQAIQTIPRRHPWTLFNQNLIQCIIDDHAMPQSSADYLREDGVRDISLMVAEMLGLHPGVYNSVRRTAETIRRIALAGNAVIVGRGGNVIAADIGHSLHVRLVGSLEVRTGHYAKHFQLSENKAAAEVARIDRARKRYLKTHYRADVADPLRYDLVINTDRLDNAGAAEVIVAALAARCAD